MRFFLRQYPGCKTKSPTSPSSGEGGHYKGATGIGRATREGLASRVDRIHNSRSDPSNKFGPLSDPSDSLKFAMPWPTTSGVEAWIGIGHIAV